MLRILAFKIKQLYDKWSAEYNEAQAEIVQDVQDCCTAYWYGKTVHSLPCKKYEESSKKTKA